MLADRPHALADLPGPPADLFETRTSRDRNNGIREQWNHVLVWQLFNLLILESLTKKEGLMKRTV